MLSKDTVSLNTYNFLKQYYAFLKKLKYGDISSLKIKRQGFDLHVTKLAYDNHAQLSIANLERYDRDFDKIYKTDKANKRASYVAKKQDELAERYKEEGVDPAYAYHEKID